MAHVAASDLLDLSGGTGTLRERFVAPWRILSFILGGTCTLYYMWVALVGIHYPQLDRSLFIFYGIALGLAMKPTSKSVIVRIVDLLVIIQL